VVFSPDGKTLTAAGETPKVWIWDVATGEEKIALKQGPE
jgi:WD40 repeat protein